jgi:hypothetical protein
MNDDHRYSSIVTSFFHVFEHPTESTLILRPGLELLAGLLVRCSAHKIYIPFSVPKYGESLDDVIDKYPLSLKNRIEVIDRDGNILNKVMTYLKPITNEAEINSLLLNHVVDFLYKLFLASKYNAEADVSDSKCIGHSIHRLKESINDAEGKIRLDQLLGIYSNYSNPLKIESFSIYPTISIPSIYSKLSDFLDETEIIEISKNRYLLGIPGRAKAAFLKIKKEIRQFLGNKKYEKYIGKSSELIQIIGSSQGIKIPNVNFKDFFPSEYNPPLVDLDNYRRLVCKQIEPNKPPAFMLPDGASRCYSDDY